MRPIGRDILGVRERWRSGGCCLCAEVAREVVVTIVTAYRRACGRARAWHAWGYKEIKIGEDVAASSQEST